MKQCSRCKEYKPFEGFNKNKLKPDGFQNECRDCQKRRNRLYSKTEKGRRTRRAYTEQYKESGKRAEVQYRYNHSEKNRASQRRYSQSEKGRVSLRRNLYARKAKFPEQDRARKALNYEVEKGRIPRVKTLSCTDCGKQATDYHHHKGYDKAHWLDVIPLCRKCHRAADHKNRHSSYSTK